MDLRGNPRNGYIIILTDEEPPPPRPRDVQRVTKDVSKDAKEKQTLNGVFDLF